MELIIIIITLVFGGLIIYSMRQKPIKETKQENTSSTGEVTTEEFFKVMDAMLTSGIIDSKQYNELCVKMGAFLK